MIEIPTYEEIILNFGVISFLCLRTMGALTVHRLR